MWLELYCRYGTINVNFLPTTGMSRSSRRYATCEFIDSISRTRTAPVCREKRLLCEQEYWKEFIQRWFHHHERDVARGMRLRFLKLLDFNRRGKSCQLDRDFVRTLENPFLRSGVYVLVLEGTELWSVVATLNYIFISKSIGVIVNQAARKPPRTAELIANEE